MVILTTPNFAFLCAPFVTDVVVAAATLPLLEMLANAAEAVVKPYIIALEVKTEFAPADEVEVDTIQA
ncbi:hypothetical protein CTheo_6650 [Ceratobasidium theobromae]|uniref:Transmembrane protein n=1 Tax=Ceratobasidium theobromae TaxID=1582974 RepID=A0A5N5QF30_9AGAM|nr:hypothetical protein CTheo_6650 [Ceratobasidium theobromae]